MIKYLYWLYTLNIIAITFKRVSAYEFQPNMLDAFFWRAQLESFDGWSPQD